MGNIHSKIVTELIILQPWNRGVHILVWKRREIGQDAETPERYIHCYELLNFDINF